MLVLHAHGLGGRPVEGPSPSADFWHLKSIIYDMRINRQKDFVAVYRGRTIDKTLEILGAVNKSKIQYFQD